MGKKKIALFYDEGTESGKQILEFLMPFDKRKSDIVGELILLWIADHGTNVPVQWLDRKKGEPGTVRPSFHVRASAGMNVEMKQTSMEERSGSDEDASDAGLDFNAVQREKEAVKPPEPVHDVSLIKAGLASFL